MTTTCTAAVQSSVLSCPVLSRFTGCPTSTRHFYQGSWRTAEITNHNVLCLGHKDAPCATPWEATLQSAWDGPLRADPVRCSSMAADCLHGETKGRLQHPLQRCSGRRPSETHPPQDSPAARRATPTQLCVPACCDTRTSTGRVTTRTSRTVANGAVAPAEALSSGREAHSPGQRGTVSPTERSRAASFAERTPDDSAPRRPTASMSRVQCIQRYG